MKKRMIPVLVAITLILILAVAGVGMKVIEKYSYSKERADLTQYFKLSGDNEVAILLQDEILEEKALLLNGTYYLDYTTVKTYFNDRFYVDTVENLLIYTTPTDIISAPIEGTAVSTSGVSSEENYVIATYQGETLYVAIDYVKKYTNLSYEAFTEPSRVQIYTEWNNRKLAEVSKKTAIRYQGGVKSDILEDVEEGDQLIVLESLDKWSKVKSKDGIIGYIENKRLTNEREEIQTPVTEVPEPEYTSVKRDHKINLAWHQVMNVTANSSITTALAQTKGINTISPTWFSLSDNEGNFTSLASADYVNIAHSMGIEVWALVDNFNENVDTKEALSSATKRAKLIQGLMNTVQQYQIDGINVDFEKLKTDASENFIEFIRELSVSCRANGIVLSIDNYVPKEYSSHYNRKEQGIVADYVIIMGYDEHYGGGDAGSVASINFVEEGIVNTLAEVPSDKVINAIPFYTRVWTTKGAEVTSTSVGMGVAENLLAQHGAEITWNEETCQNYGEYQDGDALVQVWLEDAESIQVKLNIMGKYDLGGVAEWKLGLETPNVWDNILAYTQS
ncbi:MAG: glycosyl hydrolase family 18 protein [Lachnospiraceae bacterium]|nr:glycosyl hydrolase family 18 protein [Lachnospiraceae bacterium]